MERDRFLGLKMSQKLYHDLRVVAAEKDLTLSELVRRVLADFVKNREKNRR